MMYCTSENSEGKYDKRLFSHASRARSRAWKESAQVVYDSRTNKGCVKGYNPCYREGGLLKFNPQGKG
jgi:hypothetical protein